MRAVGDAGPYGILPYLFVGAAAPTPHTDARSKYGVTLRRAGGPSPRRAVNVTGATPPVGADDSVRPIGERKYFHDAPHHPKAPLCKGGCRAERDWGIVLRWCGGKLMDATAA